MREGYAERGVALKSPRNLATIGVQYRAGGIGLLIVPLHRGLSRANFPVVTLALVLVNCFVYFFLQSSDTRVEDRAAEFYQEAGLERIEFPAFERWLATHPSIRCPTPRAQL